MESAKLNLSSLRDKISSKLTLDTSKKGKSDRKNKKSKPKDELKNGKDANKENKKSTQKMDEADENEDDVLTREALALGATKEDLALVKGLNDDQSDEEFEDEGSDKKLNAEVAQFMKGLGLSGELQVVEDDEVEEEIPDLVEENDAAGSESSEEDASEEEPAASKPSEDAKPAQPEAEVAELIKPKSYRVDDVRSVKSDKLKLENRVDWYNVEVENKQR